MSRAPNQSPTTAGTFNPLWSFMRGPQGRRVQPSIPDDATLSLDFVNDQYKSQPESALRLDFVNELYEAFTPFA
jgi:hypothetical protein